MFRWQILVAATAAVIGAASLGVAAQSDDSTDQEMELVAAQTNPNDPAGYGFTVSAAPVEGLHPGAVRTLRLTLKNPYNFDLQLTAMRADLVSTTNPGCAPVATNLEVQPFTGDLPTEIPSDDSLEAGTIALRMPNTVANECQQAVFTIKIAANATRAGQ